MKDKKGPKIDNCIFVGKQNIPWNEVEIYGKRFIGKKYVVRATQDTIEIMGDFPNEYAWSVYTQNLRGALAKVKANAIQKIDELIENAYNKRWIENKDIKHVKDAKLGWYRYDTDFSFRVMGSEETEPRYNSYKATLVVRITENGLYLYDVINIKKESA